jgi:hypothetical protein
VLDGGRNRRRLNLGWGQLERHSRFFGQGDAQPILQLSSRLRPLFGLFPKAIEDQPSQLGRNRIRLARHQRRRLGEKNVVEDLGHALAAKE